MKVLIKRLIGDEKIPNDHAEVIEELYIYISRNDEYMKYKFGSNYGPAEIMMYIKYEENNREVIGIIYNFVDSSRNAIQEYNRKIRKFFGRCVSIHVR